MYDAKFTLETLYRVAGEMQSFSGTQHSTAMQLSSETRYVENQVQDAVYEVQARLKKEQDTLSSLKSQLNDAIYHLNNCRRKDDEGRTTSEYEYWERVVAELEYDVDKQAEVVAHVKAALQKVTALSEKVIARIVQVRNNAERICSNVTGKATGAGYAIRSCAEKVADYWNLNL